jgi:hypothetical protein
MLDKQYELMLVWSVENEYIWYNGLSISIRYDIIHTVKRQTNCAYQSIIS